MKRLPKTWQGTPVVRGKGIHHEKVEALEYDKALDSWPGRGEFFIVVDENPDSISGAKAFSKRAEAVTYARACGNGNVDHRVLRCTSELLVVATGNEL